MSLKWPGKTDLNAQTYKAAAGQLQEKMQNAVAFAEEQARRFAAIYRAETSKADKTSGVKTATE